MKPTSIISTLRKFLLVFSFVIATQPSAEILTQPGLQQSTSQGTLSAAQRVSASASSCQWIYYPVENATLQPEQPLFKDPDNTPVTDLSLGELFKGKSTQLAGTGSTDFDGDNKTDVFRTVPRTDGNLQWQYSSDGTAPWQDLAYASSALPVSQLQFGEFNSDANTDVFASFYDFGINAYQLVYSPGGVDSFVNLITNHFYPDRLALGDFNGDGVIDVFTATQQNGTYQWAYSPSGTGSTINLAHSAVDPAVLSFGDFDSDGKTDVFAATQAADGSTQWLYSSGGASSYTSLITTTVLQS